MIPPVPFPDSPTGEIEVFNRLGQLPDDWSVMHSLVFSLNHGRDAEADFLVVDPAGNTISIEVKSQRLIELGGGRWLGNGKEIKDPFRQSRSVCYRVIEILGEMGSPLRKCIHGRLVIFPFADFNGQSPEFNRFEYLNGSQWGEASASSEGLQRTFRGVIDATRLALERDIEPKAPADAIRVFVERLRPELRSSSRALELQLRSGAIARALEDQRAALEAVDENDRIVVDGPAGSGKTLLAMRLFIDRLRRGERVIFLTFNRAIARSLQRLAEHQLPSAGASVMTLHALAHRICRARGAEADREGDLDRLLVHANDFLVEHPSPIGTVASIVIDESQDIVAMPGAIDLVEQVLGSALGRARWAMFGDFSHQVLYSPAESVRAVLEGSLAGASTRVRLHHNCRNNRTMLKPLSVSSVDLSAVYRGFRRQDDSADQYSTFPCLTEAAFGRQIARALAFVRRQVPRDGSIAILLGRSPSGVQAQALAQLGISEFEHETGTAPCWTTIRKAKGLEFDGVIIANVGDGSDAPELLYTGCTRAILCLAWVADVKAGDES
jgi:hypothetical protein